MRSLAYPPSGSQHQCGAAGTSPVGSETRYREQMFLAKDGDNRPNNRGQRIVFVTAPHRIVGSMSKELNVQCKTWRTLEGPAGASHRVYQDPNVSGARLPSVVAPPL